MQAIGGILLWTLADMAYPAISGISANHATVGEQGAIQVQLAGVLHTAQPLRLPEQHSAALCCHVEGCTQHSHCVYLSSAALHCAAMFEGCTPSTTYALAVACCRVHWRVPMPWRRAWGRCPWRLPLQPSPAAAARCPIFQVPASYDTHHMAAP